MVSTLKRVTQLARRLCSQLERERPMPYSFAARRAHNTAINTRSAHSCIMATRWRKPMRTARVHNTRACSNKICAPKVSSPSPSTSFGPQFTNFSFRSPSACFTCRASILQSSQLPQKCTVVCPKQIASFPLISFFSSLINSNWMQSTQKRQTRSVSPWFN